MCCTHAFAISELQHPSHVAAFVGMYSGTGLVATQLKHCSELIELFILETLIRLMRLFRPLMPLVKVDLNQSSAFLVLC